MAEHSDKSSIETRATASSLLSASTTMLGVCTTLIGLIKIIERRIGPSHVDEYVAIASLLFLTSSATSYVALRQPHRRVGNVSKFVADFSFFLGLVSIAIITMLFAYEAI